MLAQISDTGLYLPGESTLTLTERRVKLDGTRPAVICCHGHGGNSSMFTASGGWPLGLHAQALAELGYIVMSIDAGGTVPWGNQVAMDAITAAYNWLMAGRARGPRIGLMGWSMGGLTVINWSKFNPNLVSQAVAWSPAVDLIYHAQGAWAAEFYAAYGGQPAWLANSAPYDPVRSAPDYTNLQVPIDIWHSQDDPTAPYASALAFVTVAANPRIKMHPVNGVGHNPFFAVPTNTLPPLFDAADWD